MIRRYQVSLECSAPIQNITLACCVPPATSGAKTPVAPIVATPSLPEVPEEVKGGRHHQLSIQKSLPEETSYHASANQPQPPRHVFSWREFFADQAINIVASVGAFLLLIGSLSFTITTANLFVAFLVLFIVHAVFGITGFVTYRFQTFRFVATIYTIIFALLIPLVAYALIDC